MNSGQFSHWYFHHWVKHWHSNPSLNGKNQASENLPWKHSENRIQEPSWADLQELKIVNHQEADSTILTFSKRLINQVLNVPASRNCYIADWTLGLTSLASCFVKSLVLSSYKHGQELATFTGWGNLFEMSLFLQPIIKDVRLYCILTKCEQKMWDKSLLTLFRLAPKSVLCCSAQMCPFQHAKVRQANQIQFDSEGWGQKSVQKISDGPYPMELRLKLWAQTSSIVQAEIDLFLIYHFKKPECWRLPGCITNILKVF